MALMSMDNLFKKANLKYEDLEINKFYDISNKNLKIKSFNHGTLKNEYRLIKSVVYKGKCQYWNLRTKDGATLLECSEHHRVWDCLDQKYYFINEKENFNCLIENGSLIELFSIKTDKIDHIVDIEVENNENYFTNGFLSHNTGGYSIPYYSSWRGRVTKIQTIEDKGETIGQEIKVRNYKSKIGIPFRTAEMKLYFKGGFDTNNEYIDFLILFDIIQQRGAYFKSEEFGFSLQGRAKLQEWLDTHPEEYKKLKIKCNEEIAKEGKLDQNNIDPEIEENMIKEEIPEQILSEDDDSKGEADESNDQNE